MEGPEADFRLATPTIRVVEVASDLFAPHLGEIDRAWADPKYLSASHQRIYQNISSKS